MREIAAVVTGITKAERIALLLKHCKINSPIELERVHGDPADRSAIAVYMLSSGLFGIGKRRDHIGFIKPGSAKHMAPKLDQGTLLIERAYVRSFYLPNPDDDDERTPFVSICLEVEDK